MSEFDYLKRNFDTLKSEIEKIAASAGTPAPTLVCVTKSGTDEELIELVKAGATEIGENRPGEVKRRFELIKEAGLFANMHEIGTLQRNKIKLIIDGVHMIHSIDSLKLATDVNRHALAAGRKIPVLIEVNSAREEQKSGVLPEHAEQLLSQVEQFENLIPLGLMTMGPALSAPEELRPYFRDAKKLFDKLTPVFRKYGEPILSMGMSESYKIAIEEGSTLVRIGRRLFQK